MFRIGRRREMSSGAADAGKGSTIYIRRSRPTALAAALALMLTVLFVYAIAMPVLPRPASDAASAEAVMRTELRMEGMEVHFLCTGRSSNALQLRILAAQCVENGGAGLILSDGNAQAVIREAAATGSGESLLRSAPGLTLRMEGSAQELAAVTDAVTFLRAQATETGGLASALEQGSTDAASLQALLSVYRTQGQRVQSALSALPAGGVVSSLNAAVSASLVRLDAAASSPSPAAMRLVHAAACAQWLELLEDLG